MDAYGLPTSVTLIPMARLLSALALCAIAHAQPQTHVVRVNADGTFTPQTLSIKSGDTVRWEGLTRADSIIPAANNVAYPALCNARNPYDATKPNEFTGPIPLAPSGVFTLSPLDNGFTEAQGSCPQGRRPIATGDGGRVLCAGLGAYEATLDSTWRSDQNTGVFIRLLWKDVNPSAGVYDFTVLRREMEQAIRYGKVFSLGVKAGDDGTPDWIFSTDSDGRARSSNGGGIPRLRFQDIDDPTPSSCGNRMDLGNPTRADYQALYFNMWREVARVVKSRADWYRALAYVKLSGANLVSHENRLPNGCITLGSTRCICNPQVFAADGYRPSGLYSFFEAQAKLLRDLFPGKALNYALIQDGFPRVNETGGYFNYDRVSSNGAPLPGAFEQTQTIMDGGRAAQGIYFTVAHNGVQPKVPGCNFDGQHPKPERPLEGYWDVGSGCPNRWAVREGARGQVTGYQTVNQAGVSDNTQLDLAFQNVWDNTDGIYLEIYEDRFWEGANLNRGILPRSNKTLAAWADDFHRRRVDPAFRQHTAAGNPFPFTYSYTFQRTDSGSATYNYIHGMKCGQGRQEWGQIMVDAQPLSVRAGGVVSASAFGGGAAIAPGGWIEIFGSSLATVSRSWETADFNGINAPTALSGTSVRIGGQPAFVAYVSPTQVNAQVASNTPAGNQTLTVTTAAGTSANYPISVRDLQPGLLATPAFAINGRQNVVALFPDGFTYVLPPGAIPGVNARRARPGDTITLYGTGFGPVTPNVPAGQVAQGTTGITNQLTVTIGGQRAATVYAGLAPGAVGLYQINLTIPNVPANDATPLLVTQAGVTNGQSLVLAVGN